jgi:hypothetical protein
MRTDIDWVNYVYLNANETFDSESIRPFLFCLEPNSRRIGKHCECKMNKINLIDLDYTCHPSCPLNDCVGPSHMDCINKTNDFAPMSPRDLTEMLVKQETLESFGKYNYSCK